MARSDDAPTEKLITGQPWNVTWSRGAGVVFTYVVYALATLAYAGVAVLVVGDGGSVAAGPDESALIWSSVAGSLAAMAVTYVASIITNNSSCFDLFWSYLPPVVLTGWVLQAGDSNQALGARQALTLAICWLWSVRLSSNWTRFWKGMAHEDWRYVDLTRGQGFVSKWMTSLFAFHFFPTAEIYLGSLAALPALVDPASRALSFWDGLAVVVGIAATVIEGVADYQIHSFMQAKADGLEPKGAVMARGLWSVSRHPNYFGEALFWLSLYLFGLGGGAATARGSGWWWSWVGFVTITIQLRAYSVPAMEARQLKSKPEYQRVIDAIPAMLPNPFLSDLPLPGFEETMSPVAAEKDKEALNVDKGQGTGPEK